MRPLNGRRLLRAELEQTQVAYTVGASWKRRNGTFFNPAPQHAPMPEDWKSGMRCRSILQPWAFREAGQVPEYRKLRNAWKRKRRARR